MDTHGRTGGARNAVAAATWTLMTIGALSALIGGAGGCAAHASYPVIQSDFAANDVNTHPVPGLVRRALVRVLGDDRLNNRLPAQWALNLPKGTGRDVAERVLAESMAQANVTGGELVTVENQDLPVYSVTRVWVRGDRGEVDVVRPVAWTGLDDRPWTLQKVTLRLRGGRYKWDVIAARAWPVGTASEPELYGWPVTATGTTPSGFDREARMPTMVMPDGAVNAPEQSAPAWDEQALPEAFTSAEQDAEVVDEVSAYVPPAEASGEPSEPQPVPSGEPWHPIPQ